MLRICGVSASDDWEEQLRWETCPTYTPGPHYQAFFGPNGLGCSQLD